MKIMESAGSPICALMAALATSSLFLAGCSSSMAPLESVSGTGHASAQIAGKIHGGNQPVSGATVTLYRASQQTFAGGAVAIAHTMSAADGYGSFAFQRDAGSSDSNVDNTYNCVDPNFRPKDIRAKATGSKLGSVVAHYSPNSNPFLFLVARGGTTVNTPGAAPNPNSAFIAPLGRCNSITASTFVNMSEVVTVATMAALHQFMNPSASGGIETSVGADGIFGSDLALGNALYSVNNMVNLSNGYGNSSLVKSAAGVDVTVTPELAKINQLANALSACINYSGSGNPNCATLYNSAAPPSDTSTTSVGGPQMNAATDPLTALYYIFANPTNAMTTGGDGTANRTALFNLSNVTGAPYQPSMAAVPTDWTIGVSFRSTSTCSDVSGSTAGYLSTPSNLSIDLFGNVFFSNMQAGSASLGSLDGTGTPGSCSTLSATGGTPTGSMSTTVDVNGVVYAGVTGTRDAYSYNPSSLGSTAVHFTTPAPVLGLAADGDGHVFISTVDGRLFETTPGTLASTLISSSLDNAGGATSLIVDPQGRIWASGSAASTGNQGTVTYPDSASTTGYTTAATGTHLLGAQTALTVGSDNGYTLLYSTDGTSLEYAAYQDPQSGPVVAPSPSDYGIYTGGGLLAPTSLAVDGAQNVWLANSTGSISAFSLAGAALAPTGFVKDPSYFATERAISVDASGNIWVAAGPNTITEVVGAAVPVVKSYAYALQTNRFQRIP